MSYSCYSHKPTKYQQNRSTVLTWHVLCRIRIVLCQLLSFMHTLFQDAQRLQKGSLLPDFLSLSLGLFGRVKNPYG